MSDLNHNPLIEKYRAANQFGGLLKMEFFILDPGKVRYTLEVGQEHLATPSAGHGGVIAALADALLGVGALSLVCSDNNVVATLDLNISFLEPFQPGDVLTGISKPVKVGRRIIFMEGEIINQENKLLARCAGTFNAYPSEKAGY
ncbi:MAG: PaaI family thioesterase [Bacteroidota bacterium]|jgi:uncharacterized protein (TIGR00369 family)